MPNILEKLKELQQERYKEKIKKHPYPNKPKFHLGSFADAINGFVWTLKTQPNFAVEIIALILLVYLVLFLKLLGIEVADFEVLVLIVVTGLVLVTELINTSLESLSDEVAKGEYKEFIRISKDTSAAAVLVMSGTWVILNCYVFFPKIFALLLILS